MEVESLLKETRKILKKCSRLTKQISSGPSPHLLDTLNSEIVKGELLEHKLFQLCAKEGVSPNQLQLLGHKITFSQWRRTTHLPHDPADPNLDISGHLPNHTNDRQSALPVTCIETRMLNTVSGSPPSSMMFAVNHSFLDITALIPSPDWLIGVDSMELCKDERNEHEDNVERLSVISTGIH